MGHKMRICFWRVCYYTVDASLSPTLSLSGREYSSAKATKVSKILINFHKNNPATLMLIVRMHFCM